MQGKRAMAGYSLLELMVVLAIMAILATAGLPMAARSLDRLSLDGDARLVATRVRQLRETAMDLQKDVSLQVRGSGSRELISSDGTRIPLSASTSVSIVTDAPDGRLLLGWDGSVSGVIVLSNGTRKLRLRQAGILAPLVVEAVP